MVPGLTRDSLLERAPAITLTLYPGYTVADLDGRAIPVGVHALSVLAACSEPIRLGALAERANVTGARDFIDFIGTVSDLIQNGLLTTDSARPLASDRRGLWSDPSVHVAMLNDVARTDAFLRAVRQTVRPTDVVVDIGTGTGILAIAAAKAGARRVYAIESSEIADVATAMIEKNGVADRVTVVRGWSTRVSLAEQATVLVTETIGNDPFAEHAFQIVVDAKKRLLTDDARIIPGHVRLYAVLVEAPPALVDRLCFSTANIDRWSHSFGLDFSTLMPNRENYLYPASISAERARDLVELSDPVELGYLDYHAPSPIPDQQVVATVSQDGTLAAALLFFEVDVAPGVTISTRPRVASPTNHWLPTLWFEPQIRSVTRGESVKLAFRQEGSAAVLEVSR
ncbi:MAG: hypothetical protein HOW73_13640 [Polyangiaceae bacterium]|nr:hypothetical protein [Polyangiaceae bacterium]